MKKLGTAAALMLAATLPLLAQAQPAADSAKVDAMVAAAFPSAPADWRSRFDQDETMSRVVVSIVGSGRDGGMRVDER